MRKHLFRQIHRLPDSVQTILGLTTGLSVALLLKACGPLAPSLDKSRPSVRWTQSGGAAPGSSTASPYRTVFFRDQTPRIDVPGSDHLKQLAPSSEAVEAFRRDGKIEMISLPAVQPQTIWALFKLDLPDAEILRLGLEDLETTLTLEDGRWKLEVPGKNAAQLALWERVKVHLMSLHIASVFGSQAPSFTLDWVPSDEGIDSLLPGTAASPTPLPSQQASPSPAPQSID
jgi:hypothetical protein